MQGFCDPADGVKNKNGFLEYPNSTAKEMLKKIDRIADSDWLGDIFKDEANSIKIRTWFDKLLDFNDNNDSRNKRDINNDNRFKVSISHTSTFIYKRSKFGIILRNL